MSEDKDEFVGKDKLRQAQDKPGGVPEGGPAPSSAGDDADSGADAGGASAKPADAGASRQEASDAQLPKIDFATFVFSLNSAVLVHLGIIDDPVGGQTAKNLSLAKQTIDVLGMLEEKTRGNLTPDEEHMLKNILYDLRIRYVRETR